MFIDVKGLTMFHYTDCGLDNVFLLNGVVRHITDYGEGYSIQDSDGLHKEIGRWLIETPKFLNGAELRFLRLEMELTQRSLAGLLGSSEQNVRRWETRRMAPIPGVADRFLRGLYNEFVGGDGSLRRMVERLAMLDQTAASNLCMREDHGRWAPDPCAPCLPFTDTGSETQEELA